MTIEINANAARTPEVVPLRSGLPTKDELLVHYPARFTWPQLKSFINSGDLGLLKRDKKLQRRYDEWAITIQKEHGSVMNYLINHRLQWGKPDTLSLISSVLDAELAAMPASQNGHSAPYPTPEYFKADIPFNSELICIMQNSWPYSVPTEIEHTLIWSRVPVFHTSIIPASIDARIQQDGLCGFTGSTSTVDSLPSLESSLPTLAEWGITMDRIKCSPKLSDEEEVMVHNAGKEVREFVKRRWRESQWETGWFVNPPRLQSVRGLAHIHVFARKKTPEEEAAWVFDDNA
ncbi:hypothetical protein BU15DRAFT_71859 [Melanogaster broomeanus]|nr:hypothetical protein BU15DRAFT_71859 [Melanogaster broomeanus]